MLNDQLQHLLSEALMASVFVRPLEPGLTYEEILEVGRRAGHQDGTIGDAMKSVPTGYDGDRWIPSQEAFLRGRSFMPDDPEFLDYKAVDFIVIALNERVAAVGARDARVDRAVVTEAAVRAGHDRTAVQAAIVFMLRTGTLGEDGSSLKPTQHAGAMRLPGEFNRELRGSGAGVAWLPPHHIEPGRWLSSAR